jgi:hypothetical protein
VFVIVGLLTKGNAQFHRMVRIVDASTAQSTISRQSMRTQRDCCPLYRCGRSNSWTAKIVVPLEIAIEERDVDEMRSNARSTLAVEDERAISVASRSRE